MSKTREVSARSAVQVTRAAPHFDRLVDAVLAEWDSSGSPGSGRRAVNARVENQRRERLDWFFPEFLDLYFGLLREYLGPDLMRVLTALGDDWVQLYFRRMQAMQPDFVFRMQQLGCRMAASLRGEPELARERQNGPLVEWKCSAGSG